jgi:hypothetical protein
MNDRIHGLMDKMVALEDELRTALHEQETHALFQINGKRVEFECSVRDAHRRLKRNFFRWLVTDRPQNLLTGPFIYGLGIPLVFLDICVTVYQAACFPIYGIAKVRRGDYIVIDRQQLEYLNFVEKFHCSYCGYATGLIAYVSEIAARTEEYFCPIKHARKVLSPHSRYAHFLAYGDAAEYQAKLEKFRVALAHERQHSAPE